MLNAPTVKVEPSGNEDAMQGNPKIISMLNALLAGELSSMDLYLLQGRMLENWGYKKLQDRLVHESNDEREHADALIQRILFLEGQPDLATRHSLSAGSSPKEMLENDVKYEHDVARALNEGIALCDAENDGGTRALLEKLLVDTESDHIFWLESQLRLMNALGTERYLAEQL